MTARLPAPESPVTRVTPEMLLAGREAFLAKRAQLNDLWIFYPSDLESLLKAIYVAMEGAA